MQKLSARGSSDCFAVGNWIVVIPTAINHCANRRPTGGLSPFTRISALGWRALEESGELIILRARRPAECVQKHRRLAPGQRVKFDTGQQSPRVHFREIAHTSHEAAIRFPKLFLSIRRDEEICTMYVWLTLVSDQRGHCAAEQRSCTMVAPSGPHLSCTLGALFRMDSWKWPFSEVNGTANSRQ